MKQIISVILFYLTVCNVSFGQTEPQPFPLKNDKISFYEFHMEYTSIKITDVDGNSIKGIKPTVDLNKTEGFFTIDFTACASGTYLIYGKRGDVEINYSVTK